MSLWSQFATLNIYEICLVKGAASRIEDLLLLISLTADFTTGVLLSGQR